MKNNVSFCKIVPVAALFLAMMLPQSFVSQKFPHRPAGGGTHKAVTPRGGTNKISKPKKNINAGNHHAVSKPKNFQKKPAVSANKPKVTRPGNNHQAGNHKPSKPISNNKPGNHNNNIHINNNNHNNHNNIHINNNHRTNINVHVRPPIRPYHRPPHRYGGWGYYSFHPYYYHPFRPFHWGPIWHPWGYFVASLATTAIVIAVNNERYHYDQGVYYAQSNNGYTVVEAPIGATIKVLPSGYETVHETTNNYYYGGTFYEKSSEGYSVVAPTAGSVVEHLPEGAEEIQMGDQTFVKYGDTYYQPVQYNNKNMYEVAEAKQE